MSTAFKKIKDYSEQELNFSVDDALAHCSAHEMDFWKILKGVDAYMERRRRKEMKEDKGRQASES